MLQVPFLPFGPPKGCQISDTGPFPRFFCFFSPPPFLTPFFLLRQFSTAPVGTGSILAHSNYFPHSPHIPFPSLPLSLIGSPKLEGVGFAGYADARLISPVSASTKTIVRCEHKLVPFFASDFCLRIPRAPSLFFFKTSKLGPVWILSFLTIYPPPPSPVSFPPF